MMKKILIGVTITVVAGLILGFTTWNFAATQDAVKKEDHQKVHDKIDEKLDKIYDLVLDIYKRGKGRHEDNR